MMMRFRKLSEGCEQEQADLKASVDNLRPMIETAEAGGDHIQSLLEIVKKYTEPMGLTPALPREFINKIAGHAPDKSSGRRTQRIDVQYNFIREIDLPPEFSRYRKKTAA